MSGFYGVIHSIPPAAVLLEQIAVVLRRRGPDGTRVWQQPQFSGCFTLMRTGQTQQSPQQPVVLNERYELLGDVRLDGRGELIEELAQAEKRLPSDATNEELVLHAYQSWGESGFARLFGDFSFALWDACEKQLWCARHFVGARPLFYAESAGGFHFSNTLAALLPVPGISRELDDVYVGDFLLHGFCSDPERTAYRGIRRLPPGCLLRFRSGALETRRFLRLPIEEPFRFEDPREYVDGFREILKSAVKDRLPEGPAALFLSGGLDSASICALASEFAPQTGFESRLKAFTTSWRPLLPDEEAHYADLTAKHLGISHAVIERPNNIPWEDAGSGNAKTPEPAFNPFRAMGERLFQGIAAHSRVILSGDGGDDVLTGQAWPYFTFLWRRRAWNDILASLGGFFVRHGHVPPLRGGFRRKARRLLGLDDPWTGYPDWLDVDFERRAGLRERWSEFWRDSPDEHPIHPLAYASLHSAHWAVVLEGEDAGNTNAMFETRAPLLDLRLIRFLLRVPPVPWCVDKRLLRETMQGELPAEILRRPKSPLAGNPLEVCLHQSHWTPALPSMPSDLIQQFVNWHAWSATLRSPKGSVSAVNLRPYALLEWLKAVEKG